MKLSGLAQQIAEVADLEVSAVINLHKPAAQELLGKALHAGLRQFLLTAADHEEVRGRPAALRALRKLLAPQINLAANAELKQALRAYKMGVAAKVDYIYGDGADDDENGSVDDSSQLPFMRCHDLAIGAAIRLRTLPDEQQWAALNACEQLELVWLAGRDLGDSTEEQVVQREESARAILERWGSKLPVGAIKDAEAFYIAMASDGMHHDALPIAVPVDARVDRLHRIAKAYSDLGGELRLFGSYEIEGKGAERLKAQKAWTEYAARGLCFKVLGAWLRVLAIEENNGICSICYRYAATYRRCSEHATGTHESREGRLGKLLRPRYVARVVALSRQPLVKASLNAYLLPNRFVSPEIKDAIDRRQVPEHLIDRCSVLADQLHGLEHVFEPHKRVKEARKLFEEIVSVAIAHAGDRGQPVLRARSLHEKKMGYKHLPDRAIELLSLKGFFMYWFGKFTEVNFPGQIIPRGFDPRHPSVLGACDSYGIAGHLLRQRGWEEVYTKFKTTMMPSPEEIRAKLRNSTVRQAALDLKISVATLYKYLNPRSASRPRNKLRTIRHRPHKRKAKPKAKISPAPPHTP